MVDIYQFTSKLKYWTTPISDKRIPGHWRHHAGEGIVCPICPSFHHLESICPNVSTWTLRGGKVRPGPSADSQFAGRKRYTDISTAGSSWHRLHYGTCLGHQPMKDSYKALQEFSVSYVLEAFNTTAFTLSGNSGGPNNRQLFFPIIIAAECNAVRWLDEKVDSLWGPGYFPRNL